MDKFTSLLLKMPPFKGKQIKLKKNTLYAARGLCFVFVAVFAVLAAYFFIPKRSIVNHEVYSSSLGAAAEYSVNLSKNDFFEDDVLGMGENYIRSIIDSVDVNFAVDCSQYGDGETFINYTVTAITSAWYRDGSDNLLIWDQSEILIDASSTDLSQSDCVANIPVSVDPSIYSKIINEFQKDMELNVNAYYDIMFNASVTYVSDNKGSSDTLSASVSIPLTGQVFKITAQDAAERISKSFTESEIIESEPKIALFVVCLVLALLAAFASVVSVLCLTEIKPDAFKHQLSKMIASVEDRIAYVQGTQASCKSGDIRIADFDSIIRLADERALPIFCVRDDVERTAVFFVTENNQKFYYGFSHDDDEEQEAVDEASAEESENSTEKEE